MHQSKYAIDLLRKFEMEKCNPTATPIEPGLSLTKVSQEEEVDATLFRRIVCSLRYLCCTRPDLAYGVG